MVRHENNHKQLALSTGRKKEYINPITSKDLEYQAEVEIAYEEELPLPGCSYHDVTTCRVVLHNINVS